MVFNFLFHRVSTIKDPLWDPMRPVLFEKCIQSLSAKYKISTIESLLETTSKQDRTPTATISFDDGYLDNYTEAIPILNKYKVKASFYVVTDCIDKNEPTWTYLLDHYFSHTNKNVLDLNFDWISESYKKIVFKNSEHKKNFIREFKPYTKTITHQQRTDLMERITNSFNDVQKPAIMMNWDQLREISAMGHYIGSHSKTHAMLGTIQSEENIQLELEHSANRISQELGYRPVSFSYPVGSYNQTTITLCQKTGYKLALAVKQRPYDPQHDDAFEIPRIELYNESWFKTQMRMNNTLERIKKTIGYK